MQRQQQEEEACIIIKDDDYHDDNDDKHKSILSLSLPISRRFLCTYSYYFHSPSFPAYTKKSSDCTIIKIKQEKKTQRTCNDNNNKEEA